jgi:capsular polysaccharide export protein
MKRSPYPHSLPGLWPALCHRGQKFQTLSYVDGSGTLDDRLSNYLTKDPNNSQTQDWANLGYRLTNLTETLKSYQIPLNWLGIPYQDGSHEGVVIEEGIDNTKTLENMCAWASANTFTPLHIVKAKKSKLTTRLIKKHKLTVIEPVYNSHTLIRRFKKIFINKNGGMGLEALLLDRRVYCYGENFLSGWSLTHDHPMLLVKGKQTLEDVATTILFKAHTYYDPIFEKDSTIEDVLRFYKRTLTISQQNLGALKAFGFPWWRRPYVKPYLFTFSPKLSFSYKRSSIKTTDRVILWGKQPKQLFAQKVMRMEDGFLDSKSPSVNLSFPYSLVLDWRGVYYNAHQPSDLESILNHFNINQELVRRAQALRKLILNQRPKNSQTDHLPKDWQTHKNRILVVGQADNDPSIKFGSTIRTNKELLQKVRADYPGAFIIYRPPAHTKQGFLTDKELTTLCDNVMIPDQSLQTAFNHVQHICTRTSLVGFEALLRQKSVVTYGQPFYANWGLTEDRFPLDRRVKKRTLDELVAAVYIVYPSYFDWDTGLLCEPEDIIERLSKTTTHKAFDDHWYQRLGRFCYRLVKS